jgi:putative PIN family toxin of toxin-antitoxin system
MRAVIDTNVLVSAFFYDGLPNELLNLIEQGSVKHIASQEIIREYKETIGRISIRNKKPDKIAELDKLLPKIEIVETTTNLQLSRDHDDDKFINCAIDGKCKYIVSGDKDLLVIEKISNIEIMTVRDFIEEYKKKNI